nr:hypothetical protein GCM10020093_113710 [Planobispora longispora]
MGQLLNITIDIAKRKGLKQSENAELFNLVSMALADAALVAWGAKFATPIDLWRPETAIREAGTDNNGATDADPAWRPCPGTGRASTSPRPSRPTSPVTPPSAEPGLE